MIIFDENSKPVTIDALDDSISTTHAWVVDLEDRDFGLTPLCYLEEITSPAIMLDVDGFRFIVPAMWYILIADKDTALVDAVRVSDVSCSEFTAFVYGPNSARGTCRQVKAIDYNSTYVSVTPSLHRNQMLCHPIGVDSWVCIGPTDPYSRFLKNLAIGDFIY